jgi:hypothetical protein
MNPKINLRLTLRLLALCLLFAAVLLPSPGGMVRADVDSCISQLEGCYFNCAHLPLADQDACRAQCELNYNSCNTCDLYGLPPGCEDPDTIPQRWPVVDKLRRCLQGCQIYLSTDPDAYPACKANCLATYP